MDILKLNSYAENAHRVAARDFAISWYRNILPTLSGRSEYEQIAALVVEVEKLLTAYEGAIEKACNNFQKVAEDALNCSIRPMTLKP